MMVLPDDEDQAQVVHIVALYDLKMIKHFDVCFGMEIKIDMI